MPTRFFGTVRRYQAPLGTTQGVARPMLSVRIAQRGGATYELVALVDSGADASTFHIDVAHLIGIDLDRCRPVRLRGVSGATEACACAVDLEVEGLRFPVDARFVPEPVALLGRHDVFLYFQFAFDQRAHELLIEPYDG